jgi:arylsulfatase A-like enzyme
MPARPNILYVFADQMRASSLGCMGDERVRTPNLDRLAAQGALFRRAFANTPVCTPSRAELLTGKHAYACRCVINDLRLPEEQRSIADALAARGYRRGYIGKWHLDGVPRDGFTPPGRRRHGFDDLWAAYNCTHDYLHPRYYLNDSPELVQAAGYDADVQTDLALGFIERFRAEPFCLFLSWGPPHDPYRDAPREFLDLYPPEGVALRPNAEGADRAAIAGYYAHVTALDRNIGRLMAALEEWGLADNTIFAFSSDHGDMLWSHGRRNKQLPYEESIHIPLIMRWPAALPAGQVSDLLIGVTDHAPTLLGLAGVGAPTEMTGRDLSGTILGRAADTPASLLIAEYVCFDQARGFQPWRGVRTARHTYARWQQGGAIFFDNLADPYQERNLIRDPSQHALARELEDELQRWLRRTGDRFLSAEGTIRALGQWEEWQAREEHFGRGGRW